VGKTPFSRNRPGRIIEILDEWSDSSKEKGGWDEYTTSRVMDNWIKKKVEQRRNVK